MLAKQRQDIVLDFDMYSPGHDLQEASRLFVQMPSLKPGTSLRAAASPSILQCAPPCVLAGKTPKHQAQSSEINKAVLALGRPRLDITLPPKSHSRHY